MEPDFWRQRWREGRIGFHLADTHPALPRYWPSLELTAESTVFVPLCGKTRDMAWLASQGHAVTGVELVGDAIAAFFEAEGLTPASEPVGELIRHHAGPYTLFEGDLFALTPDMLGKVSAIYDRAALVALPPDMRQRYAHHLDTLAPQAGQLLICLEYDTSRFDGPPFCVDAEAVESLYGASRSHNLSRRPVPEEAAPLGMSDLHESVYRIASASLPDG